MQAVLLSEMVSIYVGGSSGFSEREETFQFRLTHKFKVSEHEKSLCLLYSLTSNKQVSLLLNIIRVFLGWLVSMSVGASWSHMNWNK